MLSTAVFLSLAMQCAPKIHPDTLMDIVRTESGFNQYAIAEIIPVKGGENKVVSYFPNTKVSALKIINQIKERKHRYSVGLAQITSTNFKGFNVDAESMLDPCSNLSVSEKILADCYERSGSLKKAVSCYYSGNPDTGQKPEAQFKNTSYTQRIGYIVPSTKQEQAEEQSSQAAQITPEQPQSFESWDVLREYPREAPASKERGVNNQNDIKESNDAKI